MKTIKKTASDYTINLINSNKKRQLSLAHTSRQSNPHYSKSSFSRSYSKRVLVSNEPFQSNSMSEVGQSRCHVV